MMNKNLKPCKPGETHNPNGRPKGAIGIKTIIKKVLNKEIEIDDPIIGAKQRKKLIEHGLDRQALRWINGDNVAGKDLLDRAYGKALDTVDMNIKNEGINEEEIDKKLEEMLKKLGYNKK